MKRADRRGVVLIALRACRLSEAIGQCLYDLQGRKLADLVETQNFVETQNYASLQTAPSSSLPVPRRHVPRENQLRERGERGEEGN